MLAEMDARIAERIIHLPREQLCDLVFTLAAAHRIVAIELEERFPPTTEDLYQAGLAEIEARISSDPPFAARGVWRLLGQHQAPRGWLADPLDDRLFDLVNELSAALPPDELGRLFARAVEDRQEWCWRDLERAAAALSPTAKVWAIGALAARGADGLLGPGRTLLLREHKKGLRADAIECLYQALEELVAANTQRPRRSRRAGAATPYPADFQTAWGYEVARQRAAAAELDEVVVAWTDVLYERFGPPHPQSHGRYRAASSLINLARASLANAPEDAERLARRALGLTGGWDAAALLAGAASRQGHLVQLLAEVVSPLGASSDILVMGHGHLRVAALLEAGRADEALAAAQAATWRVAAGAWDGIAEQLSVRGDPREVEARARLPELVSYDPRAFVERLEQLDAAASRHNRVDIADAVLAGFAGDRRREQERAARMARAFQARRAGDTTVDVLAAQKRPYRRRTTPDPAPADAHAPPDAS